MSDLTDKKGSICAVIVLYYPDHDFMKRLAIILGQVTQVVIVNNGCNQNIQEDLYHKENQNNIHVINNDKNLGIAAALNQGVRWAEQEGYSHVVTFDQDTTPNPNMIQTIFNTYQKSLCKDEIAVIGSNASDFNLNILMHKYKEDVSPFLKEVEVVITSGSFIPVTVFKHIGPFREDFFIDSVDHEYCLRARSKGYKIFFITKPLMIHRQGNPKTIKLLGIPWLKVSTSNHHPFRWYYITRNSIILSFQYLWQEPGWIMYRIFHLVVFNFIACLMGNDRIKKTKFILLGIWDGLTLNTKREIVTHG